MECNGLGERVESYDVVYRSAVHSALLGGLADWKTDTTETSANFVAKAGHSYCFSARATDASNNVSDYAPERCVAVPLDDMTASKKSSDWERKEGTGYYLKTYSIASEKGRRSLRRNEGRSTGASCNEVPRLRTVKVFLGRTLLKRINLAGPVLTEKQVIPVKTFDSTRSGKVKIVCGVRR